MEITFPNVEANDTNTDCISFPATVDGVQIRCVVSWEALHDLFDGKNAKPMDAFRAARARIEAVATTMIGRKQFRVDGAVFISHRTSIGDA